MITPPNLIASTGEPVGFRLQENEYRILMTHLTTEFPFTPAPKIQETLLSVLKDASVDGARSLLQKARALLGVGCEKNAHYGLSFGA